MKKQIGVEMELKSYIFATVEAVKSVKPMYCPFGGSTGSGDSTLFKNVKKFVHSSIQDTDKLELSDFTFFVECFTDNKVIAVCHKARADRSAFQFEVQDWMKTLDTV
jgi:hypothetical protein